MCEAESDRAGLEHALESSSATNCGTNRSEDDRVITPEIAASCARQCPDQDTLT
jgi:hypothetical protein